MNILEKFVDRKLRASAWKNTKLPNDCNKVGTDVIDEIKEKIESCENSNGSSLNLNNGNDLVEKYEKEYQKVKK